MQISRTWATPLTIGAFAVMASTGVLMFFHLDNSLQKTAHEWLGWLMVAAAALHVTVNWPAFQRHLGGLGVGTRIVGLCALALLASFFVRPAGGGEAKSPPALAISALQKAPIRSVAAVFGKSPEQARRELAAAGLVLTDDDAPLASVTAGQREKMGQALAVLSRPPAP